MISCCFVSVTLFRKELSFQLHFEHAQHGSKLSPWHDLPHRVSEKTYTMVNEIPKDTRAKMEVQPKVQGNPIKQVRETWWGDETHVGMPGKHAHTRDVQICRCWGWWGWCIDSDEINFFIAQLLCPFQDVKKGKPRYFQFGGIPFNYGMIPQTWEDPRINDKDTGCKGDGDPVDVVEISPTPFRVGSTHEIKLLGALALLDEGEMDWKIVCIDIGNPLAAKLNSIAVCIGRG